MRDAVVLGIFVGRTAAKSDFEVRFWEMRPVLEEQTGVVWEGHFFKI